MKKTWFIIPLLLTSLHINAQVTVHSLSDCLKWGEAHNLALRNSQLQRDIQHQQAKGTRAGLMPQVKATAAFDDYYSLPVQLIPAEFLGGREGEFRQVRFGTRYNVTGSIEASMPLINTSLWERIRQAKLQEQMSAAELAFQRLNLQEEIAKTYYAILLSKAVADLSARNLRTNDSLRLVAQARLTQGVLEAMEMNKINAIYHDTESQLISSQAAHKRYLHALKFLMGIEASDSLVLTEKINLNEQLVAQVRPEPMEPLLTAEYRRQELQLLYQKTELRKQKLMRLPELNAYARYTRQAQRNEFDFFDNTKPWFNIGLAGIRLDIPLFAGMYRHSAIQVASAGLKVAENNLQYQKEKLDRERADMLLQWEQNSKIAQLARSNYQLYEQNYSIALSKYRNEVYSTDQLLQEHLYYMGAQADYLRKLTEFYISKIQLDLRSEKP